MSCWRRRALYAAGRRNRRADRAGSKRGSTIAYIFLGWSLAAAVGLPAITFIASRYGWQAVHGAIGLIGLPELPAAGWRLPRGLMGAPVDLKTWTAIGRNPMILRCC